MAARVQIKPVYGSSPAAGRGAAFVVALKAFTAVTRRGLSDCEFREGSQTRWSVKFSDSNKATGEWNAIRGPSWGSLTERPESSITL